MKKFVYFFSTLNDFTLSYCRSYRESTRKKTQWMIRDLLFFSSIGFA